MHFNLDRVTLGLSVGISLNLHGGKGRSMKVLEGRVWVTQEGFLNDLFLDAGQSCTFDSAGSVILTAEGAACSMATVRFEAPLSIRTRGAIRGHWIDELRAAWHLLWPDRRSCSSS